MHVIVWRYLVPEDVREAFRATYGAEGAWAALFQRAPGFIGTQLFQDSEAPDSFLTLDIWSDQQAHAEFMAQFQDAYEALGRSTEHLTTLNTHVGTMTSLAYRTDHP